jgi:hypothetical protein
MLYLVSSKKSELRCCLEHDRVEVVAAFHDVRQVKLELVPEVAFERIGRDHEVVVRACCVLH